MTTLWVNREPAGVGSIRWLNVIRASGSRLTSVNPTPGTTAVNVKGVLGPLTRLEGAASAGGHRSLPRHDSDLAII